MKTFRMNIVPFNELIYKKCSYNVLISVILYFKSSFFPILANDIIIYTDKPSSMSLLPVACIQVKHDRELLPELGLILKEFDKNISESLEYFINSIKERLKQNEPVFTPIDLYEMKANGNWNIHYQVNHFTHDVMIIGYDDISREFYILDTDNRHCFESRISYEDLYLCYTSYLSNCIWSPRSILSLCKDPYASIGDYIYEKYKKIFIRNMLVEKKIVCGSTELIPAFCDRTLELMSTKCIKQEVVNELFSNLFLSINLKYVQYYQIKVFCQNSFEIIQYRRKILDIFNIIKCIFIKYTISCNGLMEKNIELYFKDLRRLEDLCNNQFYNLVTQEVLK